MDDADPCIGNLEFDSFRKGLPHVSAVHVAVNRDHLRAERSQLLEHPHRHEIACVDDEVGALQALNAFRGEPPIAAGKVRIGDDRQLHVS